MDDSLILATLRNLYTLGLHDAAPDAAAFAYSVGGSPQAVDAALAHLERRGLADAARRRLTLRGLAVSVALVAAESRAPAARERAA
jgi:hypothetical protein